MDVKIKTISDCVNTSCMNQVRINKIKIDREKSLFYGINTGAFEGKNMRNYEK